MPFATFAYGPYTAKYGPIGSETSIGQFEGALQHFQIAHAQEYRSSLFGDSIVGGIYTGMSGFFLARLKEWTPGARQAMWPFINEGGVSDPNFIQMGQSGTVGRAMEDIARNLVLTAVPDTPAFANGPKVRTYPKAILLPEHNEQVLFGLEMRDVPLVFRLYPVTYVENLGQGNVTKLQLYTDTP